MARWIGLAAWLVGALLALGGAVAGPAWGEDGPEQEPVFEFEVVGEARAPGEGPASVSVITETEIARSGAKNLMDLLVREPGVWVSRQGGLGFSGNVSIRGFGGSPPTQLAVLIDGHPTQMGIMGHILPTSYILDNVKRIEVLRGPAGALYGHMALGGAINIVTRGPRDETAAAAATGTGGSFGTSGLQLWGRGLTERSGYRLHVGRLNTDGDHAFARYSGDNYALAADHELRGGWEARLRAQRLIYTTFDQREVANAFAAGRPAEFIEQDYDRGDYDLEFVRGEDDRSTRVKLYRTLGEHKFEDGFHSKDFGHGVVLSQMRPLGEGRAGWGLSWTRYGGEIFNPVPLRRTFGRSERTVQVIADQPLADRTELSAGLRYAAPEDFGREILPHLGVTHELTESWSLFGSVRRGYRTPSFRELFLFGINNPDLKPESAWQYEVGARHQLGSGGQVELSIFRIEATDLIVLRPRPEGMPGTPMMLTNAGEATRQGVELGGRWPAGMNTGLYGSISHLDPGAVKEQTVRRKVVAGADHRVAGWLLSGDVQYVDRLFNYDETGTLVKVPAFTVVNLKGSRPLAEGLRLGVVVGNLLDRTYRVDPAYPYPMPGRSFRFEIEKAW